MVVVTQMGQNIFKNVHMELLMMNGFLLISYKVISGCESWLKSFIAVEARILLRV